MQIPPFGQRWKFVKVGAGGWKHSGPVWTHLLNCTSSVCFAPLSDMRRSAISGGLFQSHSDTVFSTPGELNGTNGTWRKRSGRSSQCVVLSHWTRTRGAAGSKRPPRAQLSAHGLHADELEPRATSKSRLAPATISLPRLFIYLVTWKCSSRPPSAAWPHETHMFTWKKNNLITVATG